jgi:hypothetical protein
MNSSVAFAGATVQSPLIQSIKTFRATVDSGAATPEQAIDAFSKSIAAQNITLTDVQAYAKTQMSPEAYASFDKHVKASLDGIDPAKLTSEQLGQVIGDALAGVHAEGLYWSGCAQVWTGAAIVAAAVVVGIVALVKSKSVSSIQADYTKKLADQKSADDNTITGTKNGYNTSISNTRNWQTAYPGLIQSDQNGISNDQNQIGYDNTKIGTDQNSIQQDNYLINEHENDLSNLESEYNAGQISQSDYQSQYNDLNSRINNDQWDINSLNSDINSLLSDISSRNSDISSSIQDIENLTAAIQRYTANPALAEQDAQALESERDTALANLATQEATDLANLQGQEAAAVAAAPANQQLGRELGIGAGVGAAIAAVLIVHGIHDGVSCGGGN